MQSMVSFLSAKIPAGTTTSLPVDLQASTLVGVLLPAVFTGSTVTFLVSAAGGAGANFVPMKKVEDGSSAYSVAVAVSLYVPLLPSTWEGVRFVEIVSGSSEVADRIVLLAVRAR